MCLIFDYELIYRTVFDKSKLDSDNVFVESESFKQFDRVYGGVFSNCLNRHFQPFHEPIFTGVAGEIIDIHNAPKRPA